MGNSIIQGYLIISAIIFGVVALIHLTRTIFAWTFVLGSVDIPIAASWIGFVVTASLCGWEFGCCSRQLETESIDCTLKKSPSCRHQEPCRLVNRKAPTFHKTNKGISIEKPIRVNNHT